MNKKELNICLISNDFPPNIVGGSGIYTEQLALGLALKGHNIKIITSAKTPHRRYPDNIQLFLTPKRNLLSFWEFCYQIFKHKIKNQVDIIHGSDIFHLSLCLKKSSQTKIITTIHNSYLQRFFYYALFRKFYYPFLIFLEQLVVLRSDKIIIVSEYSKRFTRRYLTANKKVETIPNGIDTKIFTLLPSNFLKQKLKLEKEKKIILFVGRLVENKRPLFLIKLARKFFPENWHLVLVGDGPLKERINKEASEKNNIHCLGRINYNQMAKIYNSSDIFVLPSKSETFSLTLNEALACGLPAVITPQTNVSGLVQNGVNGFCIEAKKNYQAWINRIDRCLNNKVKFGKNSRKKIIQKGLTEKEFIRKHEELYYELIKT